MIECRLFVRRVLTTVYYYSVLFRYCAPVYNYFKQKNHHVIIFTNINEQLGHKTLFRDTIEIPWVLNRLVCVARMLNTIFSNFTVRVAVLFTVFTISTAFYRNML